MGVAETAALREALRYFVEDIFAGPCRFDHDGYCQEHNVDKPCVVAESRRLLAATEAVREPALREHEGRDAEVAGLDAVQSAFEIAFRRPDATAAEGRALEIALTLFAQARALASTDKPDPAS